MSFHLPKLSGPADEGFPPVDAALTRPNGLLAFGGDLSPTRLMDAYAHGIFPWFSDGQPILWWSPDPRMVFRTDRVRLSSRFRRRLRASSWQVRADTAFEAVIDACAQIPRPGQDGTWITQEMRGAYLELHRLGHAHSVEVFDGDNGTHHGSEHRQRLVGGIYGVSVGRMFFGESMVSIDSGGSKVALAALAHRLHQWGWPLLDAQVHNDHLVSLGAESMGRARFISEVAILARTDAPPGVWRERFGCLRAVELGG